MGPLERSGPSLVGRELPVSVFESLYERAADSGQPLPIVVVIGPGGSGKTRLLSYLYTRAQKPVPCAWVRATREVGTRSLHTLLDGIHRGLASHRHRQCGAIPFPRYEVARWLRQVAPALGPDARTDAILGELTKLLNRRFRRPGEASHASQNIIVLALDWVVRMLLPAFVTKPSAIRRVLFGRYWETGIEWFERHQDRLGLAGNYHIDSVVERGCEVLNSTDPERRDERRRLDGLFLDALLDDLRAAYDRRTSRDARHRTVHCVALIDDIDQVAGGGGERLLEMLTDLDRGARPHPLLLVVSTQDHRVTPDIAVRPLGEAGVAGGQAVAALTERWRLELAAALGPAGYPPSKLFLPVMLGPLSREETRRCMVDRGLDGESVARIDEVHHATRGHPLAIDLVLRALQARRAGTEPSPIRRVYAEPVPAEVTGASPGQTSGQYLLRTFVEPVRATVSGDRLAALSAPRFLDRATVAVALRLGNDEAAAELARHVLDSMSRCAFTDVRPDGRLALHPLLRDQLQRELAGRRRGIYSYFAVHRRLARYFAEQGETGVTDRLYHELARGHVQTVISDLHNRFERQPLAWYSLFEALVEAPSPPGRRSSSAYQHLRARMLERGRVGVLVTALHHERELRAPTSDVPWTESTMGEAAEALHRLDQLDASREEAAAGARPARRAAQRYERMIAEGPDSGPPRDPESADSGSGSVPVAAVRDDEHIPFPAVVRRSYRRLVRVAAVLVVLALLGGYWQVYRTYAAQTCGATGAGDVPAVLASRFIPDAIRVWRAEGTSGQCIGITDGSYIFDPATRVAEEHIAEENRQVLSEARTRGIPYVTAVVVTMLTPPTPGAASKDVGAGRNELQGVYLAQNLHNDAGHVPRLRVLVANVGASSQYAPEVARQIIRAAKEDPTIVAVLGLGQSRFSTERAIHMLGSADIPMVASVLTSDRFRNIDDFFFRVAPPNWRQAAVTVAYAESVRGAKDAVVIESEGDLYSEDLSQSFSRRFGGEILARQSYDAGGDTSLSNVLTAIAARACALDPDLIYFTGRANEMTSFLTALAQHQCDPDITIFGGDDLSQLETPPEPRIRPDLRNPLYYTALASPEAWRREHMPWFYARYDEYVRQTEPERYAADISRQPNGHAVLAFDATRLLGSALIRWNTLSSDTPGGVPPRERLRDAIAATSGETNMPGAGGIVDFGEDHQDGDPRDKAVVLLRMAEFGEAEWIATCGRLSADPEALRPSRASIQCPGG